MSGGLPDLDTVAAIVREVAQAEIVPRYQALGAGDIREKAPGDFVTAADMASEAALTARLRALAPGAQVLGEEAAAADPGLFGLLGGADPVWVIDPVDGTINFAHGRPGFAVIVAWVQGGVTRAGWIHDPLEDVTVMAHRGGGAWCAGQRLRVPSGMALAAMTGAAYGRVGGAKTQDLLLASGRVDGVVNRMSSGIDYIALARGASQFQYASRSLPWDHAAGMLIAQEAGATAGFADGTPYDPRVLDGAPLAAADPTAWAAIREILGRGTTG